MHARGRGYGKVILFNEHFVVYGIPAIATSINRYVDVEVCEGDNLEVIDERLKRRNDGFELKILRAISSEMGIDLSRSPVKVIIKGNVPLGKGLGASAATCVAMTRALSGYFGMDLDDDEINRIAYRGEVICHGNPSGIDNTVSTYGGVIWFERGGKVERIKLGKRLYLVIADTGMPSSTKKAVEKVRMRMERERERFERIFEDARELVYEARRYLEGGDLKRVGDCMIRNHDLLREIGVSCRELDHLVDLSIELGALGAKLTGGGLGGNMIALAGSRREQDMIAKGISREGFEVLKVEVA